MARSNGQTDKADAASPQELAGEALEQAVKDAGIEGASSMTADEKRAALADHAAEEAAKADQEAAAQQAAADDAAAQAAARAQAHQPSVAEAETVPDDLGEIPAQRLIDEAHEFLGQEPWVVAGALHDGPEELTIDDARKRVSAYLAGEGA